jgi:hypothetical protein
MHAFFADGVDKMHILWAIEVAETATSLAVLSLWQTFYFPVQWTGKSSHAWFGGEGFTQ